MSKYWYGKYFARLFEKKFFSGLKRVKLILATGDDEGIEEIEVRSKKAIQKSSIIKFPTRINTDIFKPLCRNETRMRLKVSGNGFIILTICRLNRFKGWQFMIDCFILFEKIVPNSLFYIVGEGEDFQKIIAYIQGKNIPQKVILTGREKPDKISLLINASDLFIMGSYKEGWSTVLSEAIACGVPSCVTNFSSAKEIICEGRNGYVIMERNENLFVQGMLKATKIPRPVFNDNVKAFSTARLKEDLLNIWKLI